MKRVETEIEREPGSIWCICIHVLSAHHVYSNANSFPSNRRLFECSFEAFEETTRIFGEVVDSDDGSGEVKFHDRETKFYFSSSISALEAMFDNMPPINFKFQSFQNYPENDLFRLTPTINVSTQIENKVSTISSNEPLHSCNQILSGKASIQGLHKER